MVASVLAEMCIAHEIETFTLGDMLLSRLRTEPGCFHMVILDILLGKENGVMLARSLRNAGYVGGILFVTNAREFSLEGYSVFPTHYLLKPLRRVALREVLSRDFTLGHKQPSISVPIKGGVASILLSNILYVESQLSTSIFHLKNGDVCATLMLKRALQLLPEEAFVQCHKSFIVPVNQIRDITRSGITLRTGQTLPVGRVYYDATMTQFTEHLQD